MDSQTEKAPVVLQVTVPAANHLHSKINKPEPWLTESPAEEPSEERIAAMLKTNLTKPKIG